MTRFISYVTAVVMLSALASAQAPDVILFNGKIFTSRADQLWTETIASRGERVSAVGGSDSIRPLAGAQTRVIDLDRKTLVPSFNDAHWHLGLNTPPHAVVAPGSGASPDPLFADVLSALRAAAATTPTSEMLAVTVGARVMSDPKATRFAVDEAAPNHRVSMTTLGHGSLFYTATLRSIGVGEEDTPGWRMDGMNGYQGSGG